MIDLPLSQALDVWFALCAAYHGRASGEDGHEVEVPLAGALARVAALHDLLRLFGARHNAHVEVNGRRLGAWVRWGGLEGSVRVRVRGRVRRAERAAT